MKEFKNPLYKEQANTSRNTTSNIEDPTHCPVCNKKLELLKATGIPANVCLAHNIALPVKD